MALVNKSFSDIITFTRASTGTYFDSAGVLQTAAINAPRFDYNPATLAAQGLLIEEARTNLAFPSNMPTSTVQTVTGNMQANGTTQITSGVSAPDGSTDGFTVSGASATTNANGADNVRILSVIPSALTYTVSMWLKTNGSATTVSVRDTASNTLVNKTTTANWTRQSFTLTSTGSGNIVILSTAGAAFDCFGVQVEAGAFPTSYIPTTTTALTRSRDDASVNTLSPWYNATEGTLFVRAAVGSTAATAIRLAAIDDGTTGNVIRFASGTVSFQVLNAGSVEANLVLATLTDNVAANVAGAYKANDFAASINGGAAVTDNSGTIPTVNRLILGAASGVNPRQTWIQRLTYYPRRLSNAELVSITTP